MQGISGLVDVAPGDESATWPLLQNHFWVHLRCFVLWCRTYLDVNRAVDIPMGDRDAVSVQAE